MKNTYELNYLINERYWRDIFQSVYDGKIDTWDYQWLFACWVNSALTVLPNVNMICNIGFGLDATHTTTTSNVANLELVEITFPLIHPTYMIRNVKADKWSELHVFGITCWISLKKTVYKTLGFVRDKFFRIT